MQELFETAVAEGISLDEFLLMCDTAYKKPWEDEEGRIYIEIDEGRVKYMGRPTIILGQGSLPPNDPFSIELLKGISEL